MKKAFLYSSLSLLLLFSCAASSTAQIITTVAGHTYGGTYCCDGGPATAAGLVYPTSVAADLSGNFYIYDGMTQRIRIVNSTGIISTFAGTGVAGFSGDGGAATNANFNFGNGAFYGGIVTDNVGNLYISDVGNNRVRKVNTSGIITTIAGNGIAGFAGDGGPATDASFSIPSGIAIDLSGNIYVADQYNNRVRKIDTFGVVTTIAGNGSAGFSGDGGPATAAQLSYPLSVAVDTACNVFIFDYDHIHVRKVTPSGSISTYAGGGSVAYVSGLGGPATNTSFDDNGGLAVDAAGNLYVAGGMYVAMVSTSGIITNVAGAIPFAFCGSGDGGPATSAGFNEISGVAIDAHGNMYIANSACAEIKLVSGIGVSAVNMVSSSIERLTVYPNPAHGTLNISVPEPTGTITLVDISGKQVLRHIVNDENSLVELGALPCGTYFAVWADGNGNHAMQKVVVE